MNNRNKNFVITILFAVLVIGASVLCIFKPSDAFSESERRELASFPEFSFERVINGEFIADFETYATERFPYRDILRGIKASFSTKVMGKLDNNGLFVADGHISKIDSALNEEMLNHSGERFSYLYDSYLKDKSMNIYFSVIPDKNYFIAEKNGYPSLDYPKIVDIMKNKTDYMDYIDVTELLDIDDYYRTDTHWKQESIVDVAKYFANKMGSDIADTYNENTLDNPFYGVYHGQLAMPFEPDTINYLTNEIIDNFVVTYFDSGKPQTGDLYNMEKAYGKDPYEMFLSGSSPLVTIDNPLAANEKELIVFRDSYGSSILPLIAQGYSKTTIIDIRYLQSSFLGNLIDFNENSDVLFIYSATLLNNSLALR